MKNKIEILLADDHIILRNGLKLLLSQESDMIVVGGADNGREAIDLARELKPDIVLMDISMPVMNGLEATRLLRKELPEIKVIILTMHEADEYVYEIFDTGAHGCLLKRTAHEHIFAAIRSVYRGNIYISPSVSQQVIDTFLINSKQLQSPMEKPRLTKREIEILRLVAEGKRTGEISELLHISPKTVESHRHNISKKLNLNKLADFVKYAVKHHIIEID